MRKVTLLLLLAFVFVAGSVLAQNSGFGLGHGGMKGPMMHNKMHQGNPFGHPSFKDITRAREELNLSDDQVGKLKKLGHEFRLAQVDRRASIEKAQIELNSLKMDRSTSEKSVMAAIDKVAMAKAEMEKAQYRFHNQMRAVLSDDQLEKWDNMKMERHQGMRQKMHGMGMGQSGWFGQSDDDEWGDDDWDRDDVESHEDSN